MMATDIRGISKDPALRARVVRRLHAALAPLRVKPVAARVIFSDENGPKGGIAIRCALMVRLPYRPTIRVEDTAATARLAFDGSFAALERRLARYRIRTRDLSRRPKKYFMAKRVLAAGLRPGAQD
ncbi:MAG TPA: HPF/RaiA family ribosome-associated protein [Candidatus Methylomirabilis sp.]|nr:HPF/RaiA family ribosome-associated protein [Candidatus Methylomirabilis sp.]